MSGNSMQPDLKITCTQKYKDLQNVGKEVQSELENPHNSPIENCSQESITRVCVKV